MVILAMETCTFQFSVIDVKWAVENCLIESVVISCSCSLLLSLSFWLCSFVEAFLQICWLSFPAIFWDLITNFSNLISLCWGFEENIFCGNSVFEEGKNVIKHCFLIFLVSVLKNIRKWSKKNQRKKIPPPHSFSCSCQIPVSTCWQMYL